MTESLGPWALEAMAFNVGDEQFVIPKHCPLPCWSRAFQKLDPAEDERVMQLLMADQEEHGTLSIVPLYLKGTIHFVPKTKVTYKRPEEIRAMSIIKRATNTLPENSAMPPVATSPKPVAVKKKQQKALF